MVLRKKHFSISNIVAHFVLIAGGFIMIYPLIFIIMSSFFTAVEFNSTKIGFFPIANNPTWANIKMLFFVGIDKSILIYYQNTILRTIYGTFNACLTALLAGYTFARLKFKGRDILFFVFLATTMLPTVFSAMPTFLVLYYFPFGGRTGLYDTMGAYVLINGPVINIMGMFLVRQTIMAMPNSLEEAAKIDGAGRARIIFQIVLPMIRSVIGYIAIINAIGLWNDWQVAFFFTRSDNLQVLASALTRLTRYSAQAGLMPDFPAMMALSLLLAIPSGIIFFVFQKNIVQGLMSAGIKG